MPVDYKKKLTAIDRQYYHTAVGATAPLMGRINRTDAVKILYEMDSPTF